MSALQTCPSQDDLSRLTDANLPAETLDGILSHLEQCAKCTAVVRQLNERQAYREPKLGPTPALEPVDSVELSRLMNLLQRVGPSTQRSTVTNSQAMSDTLFRPSSVVPADALSGGYPFLSSPQADGELGRLGDYVVLRLLGSGGMGMVFEAEDPHLRRRVALKVMQPSHAVDPAAKQRFLVEARATAAIEHEHIVVIYQVGESAGVPYLAMQLLRGESLADRLAKSPQLPVREALRIAKEIAEGLAAAHARGLIHRDIKPANIWLDAKGDRVKVVDFGLARDLSADAQLTQSGAITGTPAYMSPEQVNSKPLDAKSDLFSLGSVLYRMLAGRQPFEGEGLIQVLTAVCNETPKAISSIRADVPPQVVDLVSRLMHKQAALRPGSAREVADELQTLLGQFSNESGIHVAAAPVASAGRHGGRRKVGLAVAGAAAFFFAGFGIWVSIRDKDGKEVARVYAPEGTSAIVETTPTPPVPKVSPPSVPAPSLGAQSRLSPAYLESQRALALWVISRGGKVGLDGQPAHTSAGFGPGKALPTTSFRVTSIDLWSAGAMTESDLSKLGAALDLEELLLNTKLSEAALQQLGKLTTLRVLALNNSGVLDHWILPLTQLNQLRVLRITEGSGLTDAAFEVFEKLTTLTELNLRSSGRFRGREMHRLKNISGLDTLVLEGIELDDAALPGIGSLTSLGYLDLAGAFSDDGFEHLMALTKLRRIGLGIRGVSDAKVSELIRKNRFKDVIVLANSRLTAGIVDALCEQTQVRVINLPSGFPTTGIERIYQALPTVVVQISNSIVPRISGLTAGDAPPFIAARPALQFDGVDDYVDITSEWRYDGKPITFEAWLIPDEAPTNRMSSLLAVENGNSSQPNGLILNRRTQSGEFGIAAPPATPATQALDLCIPGRLTHLAVVWNASERRIYLNGRRVPGKENNWAWPNSTARSPYAWIGAIPAKDGKSPAIEGWGGKILGVRMTSKAVYEADFQPATEFTAEKDTICLYRFDEGQGGEVRDLSGHNRHGRIVGASWTNTKPTSTP